MYELRCAPAVDVEGRGGPLDLAPPRRATFVAPPRPPPPKDRRGPETGAPRLYCGI